MSGTFEEHPPATCPRRGRHQRQPAPPTGQVVAVTAILQRRSHPIPWPGAWLRGLYQKWRHRREPGTNPSDAGGIRRVCCTTSTDYSGGPEVCAAREKEGEKGVAAGEKGASGEKAAAEGETGSGAGEKEEGTMLKVFWQRKAQRESTSAADFQLVQTCASKHTPGASRKLQSVGMCSSSITGASSDVRPGIVLVWICATEHRI